MVPSIGLYKVCKFHMTKIVFILGMHLSNNWSPRLLFATRTQANNLVALEQILINFPLKVYVSLPAHLSQNNIASSVANQVAAFVIEC